MAHRTGMVAMSAPTTRTRDGAGTVTTAVVGGLATMGLVSGNGRLITVAVLGVVGVVGRGTHLACPRYLRLPRPRLLLPLLLRRWWQKCPARQRCCVPLCSGAILQR